MRIDDIDLTDLDRFAQGFPHPTFSFLRREAPVWFHPPTPHTPGGEGFWVLSCYTDVQTTAADATSFSSATGGGRDGGGTLIEDLPAGFAAAVLLNMMDDPRHKRIRKLVTPSVAPRALAAMEEELRQRTAAILDAAAARGRCDFVVDVAAELVAAADQWLALREDRSLLPGAVEEVLRWAPSTPYNRRTATRDVHLRSRTIHAGDKVTLWWASANRDEEVFPDPFRFDVLRAPNPHLTFGHGAHFCLGANLARIEIRLVLEGLLDRFETVELAGPIEWTRSNKRTSIRHMPVAFRGRR